MGILENAIWKTVEVQGAALYLQGPPYPEPPGGPPPGKEGKEWNPQTGRWRNPTGTGSAKSGIGPSGGGSKAPKQSSPGQGGTNPAEFGQFVSDLLGPQTAADMRLPTRGAAPKRQRRSGAQVQGYEPVKPGTAHDIVPGSKGVAKVPGGGKAPVYGVVEGPYLGSKFKVSFVTDDGRKMPLDIKQSRLHVQLG